MIAKGINAGHRSHHISVDICIAHSSRPKDIAGKSIDTAVNTRSQPKSGVIYISQNLRQSRHSIANNVGIDARSKFYPDEQSFIYHPMAGREDELRFTPENLEKIIRDYNLKDLAI